MVKHIFTRFVQDFLPQDLPLQHFQRAGQPPQRHLPRSSWGPTECSLGKSPWSRCSCSVAVPLVPLWCVACGISPLQFDLQIKFSKACLHSVETTWQLLPDLPIRPRLSWQTMKFQRHFCEQNHIRRSLALQSLPFELNGKAFGAKKPLYLSLWNDTTWREYPSFQIDAGSKCLLTSCSCTYHPCRKQLWALALQPHACACSPDQNLGKTLDKTQAPSFAEAHPLRSLHGSTFRILAQPTTVIDLLNFSTQRSWQKLLDMKVVQFCHSDHFPPYGG